jgi:hypothetical protein
VEACRFHQASNSHSKCCDIDLARNFPEEASLVACRKKLNSKMFEHLWCLFNKEYYIAKFNKLFTDFRNLTTLLSKHDVDTGPESVVEEY